ncbi:hypothetical protein LCGC14_2663560 [marine sediment metagenome]|uniref:Uncharacterized protein n=1 Tax=marine sediment metagenome TaxID=412755 RepID=A0A0F8ZR98_9ZZZZ
MSNFTQFENNLTQKKNMIDLSVNFIEFQIHSLSSNIVEKQTFLQKSIQIETDKLLFKKFESFLSE